MQTNGRTGVGFLFGLVCVFGSASALGSAAPIRVTANDGSSGDHYGYAVAVSGNTLVVGAPGDDAQGFFSGSVYVYVLSGGDWQLQAKLQASDGASQAAFGQAVSISADSIVVGAPYSTTLGTPAGAAYVFTRSGSNWTQQAKLIATDYVVYDYFGSAVSISGNNLAVGAPYSDAFGADSGAAYLFTRIGNTWNETAKLVPHDGRSDDLFGSSVSVNGSTLASGAPNDADNAVASGSAYLYFKSGSVWVQVQKLRPSDGQNGDLFGNAVAVYNDDLLIGAPEHDGAGIAAGAAYHYARSSGSWLFNQKLVASDASAGDFFGAAVALGSNRVAIGAFLDDDLAVDTGSTYVFTRGTTLFTQSQKIVDGAAGANENFGAAVAIDGYNLWVGADQADALDADAGSVFYTNLDPNVVAAVPALGLGAWGLSAGLGVLGMLTRRRLCLRRKD